MLSKKQQKYFLIGVIVILVVMTYQSRGSLSFINPQGSADWGNLKFAANIYAPSVIPTSDAEWLDNNIGLIMTHESLLDDLNGRTPSALVYMYKTAGWNADTDSVGVCCYNQLQGSNEAWFLHQGINRLLDPNTGHESYWMNYVAQGWRDHSIQDINSDLAANSDTDGLFYDAIQIERGEIGQPDEFQTDTLLQQGLFTLLDDFDSRVSKPMIVNIAPYSTGGSDYPGGPLALGKKFIDNLDGVFDESLGIRWNGAWYPDDIIDIQLQMMDYANSKNKIIIDNILLRKAPSEFDNLLGLYMIGSNDNSYLGIYGGTGYNLQSYKDILNQNKEIIKKARWLGSPTGARSDMGAVYSREFSNGHIVFHKSTHVATFHLDTPVPECVANIDCPGGYTCEDNVCVEGATPVCSYPSSVSCVTLPERDLVESEFYQTICSNAEMAACADAYMNSQIVCGNNDKEIGEVCDGTDLNSKTCLDFNFDSGTLACSNDCSAYIYTSCTTETPKCSVDADCASGQSCINKVCVDNEPDPEPEEDNKYIIYIILGVMALFMMMFMMQ